MNSLKNLGLSGLGLVLLVGAALILFFFARGDGPSDSLVKSLMQKKMETRFKGCEITSMTLIRDGKLRCQAHQSKVAYGTMLYPVSVKVVYTTKLADGSRSDSKDIMRTLYLYKDPSGKWVNDDELH
jgi:hypothetical protein